MAIYRWGTSFDPFSMLQQMRREMERVGWPWAGERRIGGGSFPPVNVYESSDAIRVQCEVPGVRQNDLEVSITGDTLVVKGKKEPLADAPDRQFIIRERGSGEFVRTIVLPDAVQGDKIQAELTSGILTILMPKAEAAKPKQIQIRTAAKEA